MRPTFIDLRSKSSDTLSTSVPSPSLRTLPSPRMQHFAGDIPPAMSPLDMFAAQSRMLAKQLDDSKKNGRRVSRLPPLTTTDPITKQTSNYQRSRSTETHARDPGPSPRSREEEMSGSVPEVEEPEFRPQSFYPRMSNIPAEDDEEGNKDEAVGPSPEDQPFVTPGEFLPVRPNDYFGNVRPKSPEYFPYNARHMDPSQRGHHYQAPRNPEPPRLFREPQREMSLESTSSAGYPTSLAPPRSQFIRQAGGSIRSIPQDSSDDEHSASTGGSGFSTNRKLSSSSGVSIPNSPYAPSAQAHGRSPSLNSEVSIGGSLHPRPAFNFSRPISRASQPSTDMQRQRSFDSRPSIDTRPSFGSISRQPSEESQRYVFHDDIVHTPTSMDNEHISKEGNAKDAPAPSYIYAKYSLPRGRLLSRDSKIIENKDLPMFHWDHPPVESNVRPTTPPVGHIPPHSLSPSRSPKPSSEFHRPSPRFSYEQRSRHSPSHSLGSRSNTPPRPSFDQKTWESPRPSFEQMSRSSPRPSVEQAPRSSARPSAEQWARSSPRPSVEAPRSSPRPSAEQWPRHSPHPSAEQWPRSSPRPSTEQRPRSSPRPSTEQVPKMALPPAPNQSPHLNSRPPPAPVTNDDASEYTASTRSGSTIKAHPRQKANSMDLSAEDHLAKGIALHEAGEARESTYHLRIAAKQNSPTAMLLYALACRHGWGMRPNQQEGVQWLRKAADCASLEIAIDEDQGDVLERKTRRAQFALSIYELGVSHMNGWGIDQDKGLALRCFEIAANWGDADAMAEAGFCYAQGQGCKKDMKKAAKYYRMAEAKGMSMVGNSWIYKAKYSEDVIGGGGGGGDAGGGGNDRLGRKGGKQTTTPEKEKKGRDKSRTRTIFGRKKSVSKP